MKKTSLLIISSGIITILSGTWMNSCKKIDAIKTGEYVAGDFHQHTTYSGGDYSFGHVMEASNKYGLDWWSNSDHGGVRELWGKASGDDFGTRVTWQSAGIKPLGDHHEGGYMWRWQSLKYYNFQDVLLWRRVFPEKLILQAFEWNVPGHQHANVSIIANQFDKGQENCDPLAQFEYMFDDDDLDTRGGSAYGWEKSNATGKEKAREAIKWIQSNYPGQAYVIPSHPDKSGAYKISDFRDFNNLAPDICFGFDGMPGHQKNRTRGGYDVEEAIGLGEMGSKQGATFGGAGIFMAQIGGVWDALLSEGRNWWVSASSDYHSDDDFYPGEYQKTYTYVTAKNDPQALIEGMRSGNSFIVSGDLITDLNFTVEGTMMGQSLKTDKKTAVVEILVLDPDQPNFNTYSDYTNPVLDHIDLIAGHVSGIIPHDHSDYNKDNVSTTSVIARFNASGGQQDANGLVSQAWEDLGNGWKKITHRIAVKGNMYLRIRGTNHQLNTPGELDGAGNPLPDIAEANSAAKAFSDLWFYSNPVFIQSSSNSQ